MATTEPIPSSVDPEDRKLLEKLSKLQDINNQIFELRTLLPEKLINPSRALIEVPGNFAPEKLAAHLRNAAIKGSKDIQTFKRGYHSEAMLELWQSTNSSEHPQGQDPWTIDYTSLLKSFDDDSADLTQANSTVFAAEGPQHESEVFRSFQSSNPSIEVRVYDEAEPLPADVSVSGIKFHVTKATDQAESYTIELAPEQATSALPSEVLQQLQFKSKHLALPDVLSLIGSYEAIKSTPCGICNNIYDKDLKLPIMSERIEKTTNPHQSWRRLHATCSV